MPKERIVRVATALLAFVVPLGVYAFSSSPNPGFWDLGEMETVPYLFGISHPTGFPLFVLLGWLLSHAIPFGTIAWRITMVASLGAAAASFALWLALDALDVPGVVAVGAAWWFAFGDVVWVRASRPDVHALEVGCEALALAFAIRYYRKGGEYWAMAAACATGCALATHPNGLWLLPAVVILLWRRGAPYGKMVAWGIAPLLTYLYIPLRSLYLSSNRIDPTVSLGVPPGQPFWNYGDPHTLAGFWWLISGAQWHSQTHQATAAMLNPLSDLQGIGLEGSIAVANHGAAALALALCGFVALALRAPRIAGALFSSVLCWAAFLQGYQSSENDPPRYALATLWVLALCLWCLWFVVQRFAGIRLAATACALLAGLSSLWVDRGRFLERGDPLAAPYISRVMRETGPNDVIVAQWTYVTPLGYAKYVERLLGDRNVVNGGPPDTTALIRELASKYQTDVVLERPVAMPGVVLRPLDHEFPTVFRVEAR